MKRLKISLKELRGEGGVSSSWLVPGPDVYLIISQTMDTNIGNLI